MSTPPRLACPNCGALDSHLQLSLPTWFRVKPEQLKHRNGFEVVCTPGVQVDVDAEATGEVWCEKCSEHCDPRSLVKFPEGAALLRADEVQA